MENIKLVTAADIKAAIKEAVAEALAEEREKQLEAKKHEETMLNSEDAKRMLNITDVTLWRWEKEGIVTFAKVGRKKLYNKADILNLIASGKVTKYSRSK